VKNYEKILKKNPDLSDEEKAELEKLSVLQSEVAIGASAESFVRHPFFQSFEDQMNAMISDSKNGMMGLVDKPDATIADIKAYKAGIEKIVELKNWINKKVLAGRIANQAIKVYEEDLEKINQKVQEFVAKGH
jgi:hypothetical protein